MGTLRLIAIGYRASPWKSVRRQARRGSLGFVRSRALLDGDNLTTAIRATGWADVVRALLAPALAALDEVERRNKVVAAAVALAMPADFLLW